MPRPAARRETVRTSRRRRTSTWIQAAKVAVLHPSASGVQGGVRDAAATAARARAPAAPLSAARRCRQNSGYANASRRRVCFASWRLRESRSSGGPLLGPLLARCWASAAALLRRRTPRRARQGLQLDGGWEARRSKTWSLELLPVPQDLPMGSGAARVASVLQSWEMRSRARRGSPAKAKPEMEVRQEWLERSQKEREHPEHLPPRLGPHLRRKEVHHRRARAKVLPRRR
mmetsp:Transcript_32253/g.73501  ORF Transcript_32253/g.73501 Transcript_32253/m.73501 type:complete len:231 (+) Transcript_32253:591-1283(+)